MEVASVAPMAVRCCVMGGSVALLLAVGTAARQVPDRPLIVAVAHPPGALLPIARFADGTWVNTWPSPTPTPMALPSIDDVPAEWLGGPVPRRWTLWRAAKDVDTVTVTGVRGRTGSCVVPTELTYVPVTPASATTPALLPIGVAVTNNQRVEGFRRLHGATDEWRLLVPVVQELFRANEQRLLRESQSKAWVGEALAGVNLSDLSINLEFLYRPAGDDPRPMYYFEAAKRVKGPGLLHGVTLSGWLTAIGTGWSAVDLKGGPFGIDSAEADLQQVEIPRGLIRVGPRVFWITSRRGYEWFGFHLYEVSEKEVRRLVTAEWRSC